MGVQTKLLGDGVEIRLIGEDGQIDAVVEVTRPAYHGLLVSYLLRWQRECALLESAPPSCERVIQFPTRRSSGAA